MANNVRGLIINSLKQYHDEIKDGLITSSERTNWNSYANVQADWNVTNTSSAAYIKNKPTIPSITGLATETYVNNKVAGIVNSAPETLDTLNELAAALGNDPNFATTVSNQIGTKVSKTELVNQSYVTLSALDTRLSNSAYLTSETKANWNESDSSSAAYILNKPEIPEQFWVKDSGSNGIHTSLGMSWAEGSSSIASGSRAGANGDNAISIGNFTNANGDYSQAFGLDNTANGVSSHAEGHYTRAHGDYSHSEGEYTTTAALASHSEGGSKYSYLFDNTTTSDGVITYWRSQGTDNKFSFAGGIFSHIEGVNNLTIGIASHAEGGATFAQGSYTHTEGFLTTALNGASHAEGSNTTADNCSHAEGFMTYAWGGSSHTEGYGTEASQGNAHAEGSNTTASGVCAHSEGIYTKATGDYSHSEGNSNYTYNISEHAEGQYNQSHRVNTTFGNAGNTIHSIGIGTESNNRKNAFEIMQNGNAYLYNAGNYNGSTLTSAKPLQQLVVPNYSSSDANKILSVNSSGQLVWITPVSIYTGSATPNNANGNDGDIYLQQ